MGVTYTFPDAATLMQIDQDWIHQMTLNDPIFEQFPIVTKNDDVIQWEQKDNYYGLQNVRGIGGQPGRVARVGVNRYSMVPGYYGDWDEINEQELTRRRKLGTFDQHIDISDLVLETQELLTAREIDRIRNTCWALVQSGTFTVTNAHGDILVTDTFPIQTFTAGTPWSTFATSTPLADFRAAKLKALGHSTRFNSSAVAYMNMVTYNNLISNTNASDLFGRRTAVGGNTVNNLAEVNKYLLDDDLPQIQIYEEGYYNLPTNRGGTFSRFLANGKVVVLGKRMNNATIGEYRMTINANNPNLEPGSYMHISDSVDNSIDPVPRRITVNKGHNGGPVIYYPSSVLVMNV